MANKQPTIREFLATKARLGPIVASVHVILIDDLSEESDCKQEPDAPKYRCTLIEQ